jgi:uncharacterized membrane protein YesL
MTSDLVNGLWELGGAILLCANIRQLHRDKEVRGFRADVLAFFTAWGIWNCYFYPANGLPLSFAGGALLALANLAYVLQVVYYLRVKPALDLIDLIETKDGKHGTDL